MSAPAASHLAILFLYDIADAIDLEAVRDRVHSTVPARLTPKAAMRPAIQYQQPPIAVEGSAVAVPTIEGFSVRFKVFDYGVISVLLTRSIPSGWEDLFAQGLEWYENAQLADAAEQSCRTFAGLLHPALIGPRDDFLAEDYFIVAVAEPDGPTADALIATHGDRLAQLLRGERGQLSQQERDEVLRHRISYFATDLVIPTWNGALVVDNEPGIRAAIEILEFANSQLLEFRYYDRLLDKELARIYARLQRPRWPWSWFGRYTRAARELHALFIDVNELTDRTENALKIAGDVYTARLFALTATRLGLDHWKANVRDKLKTLDDIYRFAVDQTAMARGQFLELTVVLILIIELVLLLAGIR